MPSLSFAPALALLTRPVPVPAALTPLPRRFRHGQRFTPRRLLCVAAASPTYSVSASGAQPLAHALQSAPSSPGVYRFLDARGVALYIGKARQLSSRLRQYLIRDATTSTGVAPSSTLSPRLHAMVRAAVSLDLVLTPTESAALALEASLVRTQAPRYNVKLKDDRRHPYALITFSEDYPRITLTRSRRIRPGDRLYGPFVDEPHLRRLLSALHAALPLRQRARPPFRDRPCINYDMGRCPGVCQQLVSVADYAVTVARADRLLAGRVDEVLAELRAELAVLSDAMLYREAATLRDRIALLARTFLAPPQTSPSGIVSMESTQMAINAVVDLDPLLTRDVLAAAATSSTAKIVLLQIRAGRIVSRLVFSATLAEGPVSLTDALSATAAAHYGAVMDAAEIPGEIILTPLPPDGADLEATLSARCTKPVRVCAPTELTRAIAELAECNARSELTFLEMRRDNELQALGELEKMLKPFLPMDVPHGLRRIECVDVSHTNGAWAVAAFSVVVDGEVVSKATLRVRLSDAVSAAGRPDDYASVEEAVAKRLDMKDEWPALLVVDGGKGQLAAARRAMRSGGGSERVAVIALAKERESVFVDGVARAINEREDGNMTVDGAVRVLCRARDAAHAAAVQWHRVRREKGGMLKGVLAVQGVGRRKYEMLMRQFDGSGEAIAAAEVDELMRTPGIGRELAERVVEYFREARGGDEGL